ncbi:MAG: hypothetical protein ACW98F_20090 [Candidatus Hodarchaeales archaeon]|jgi:hypothetical protein
MFSKNLILLLISLLISSSFLLNSSSSTPSSSDFSWEIIGYYGKTTWAAPSPPNFTGVVTWDYPGYTQLAFRLTYLGSSSCVITSLIFWQELTVGGSPWNYTGPISIPYPTSEFHMGDNFEFVVQDLLVTDPVTLSITTFLSSSLLKISVRGPLSHLTSMTSTRTLPFPLFVTLFVLFFRRKTKILRESKQ